MKLLFLTPQLPYPPHQGTAIRNLNILLGLAARHQIDLLSFGTPEQLEDSPLRQFCHRVELVRPPTRALAARAWDTFFYPLPDMARRLESAEMSRRAAELLASEQYDAVQLEGIEMGRVLPDFGQGRPCVVFDDHNAEYVLQQTAYRSDRRRLTRLHAALYSWIQWHKLVRFERDLCLAVDAVVAVSAQDAAALSALDPRIDPTVVENGVDLEYYRSEFPSGAADPTLLTFTGKMDFRPNVDAATWFASEILPLLQHEVPAARVAFVGQQPTPAVRSLQALPGVTVTGWVPDIRPHIAPAAVFVVPLRMGGGTRLKVLEALAMGKAIVSTSLGVAGLDVVDGHDLLLADSTVDFARAVASLLRDPARRAELGRAARRLAESRYSWTALIPRFEEIYARVRESFDNHRTHVL